MYVLLIFMMNSVYDRSIDM